jgi:hypothetical protein
VWRIIRRWMGRFLVGVRVRKFKLRVRRKETGCGLGLYGW